MTKDEKELIFNRLLELEEQHPAFDENVRDNAYCEAIADVKRIIDGIKEPSLPSNLDEAAENIAWDIAPNHPDISWDNCFEKIKKGIKAGAEWMAGQGGTVTDAHVIELNEDKKLNWLQMTGNQLCDALKNFNIGDKVVVQIRKK